MKPAPFEYVKPASLEEAGLLLSRHSDAKLLAGGQTLVPMLNFRLVSPALLVDINDLPALDTIVAGLGGLHLGALVRWYQIAASKDIARACPLLSEAVAHVAHYQIRNRGTWAGSCAHADPAAEFPAVAIASGAVFELYSARGRRSVPAENFFLGPLTTALEPDEILIGASFPLWPEGRLCAFEEFAFRRGDFATAGIAATIDPQPSRVTCRLVSFGVGDKPERLLGAEAMIESEGLSPEAIARCATAARDEVDARSDIHASADYRRALIEVLVERSLRHAAGLGASA